MSLSLPNSFMSQKKLLKGSWLSDVEINEFLRILRRQFPNVNGLEDIAVLYQRSEYIERTGDFVRVLLSDENHWVCVYGKEAEEEAVVHLYDSLSRTKIDECLGEQVLNFLPLSRNDQETRNMVKFFVKNTSKQKRDLCGYFALAYAAALCFEQDPEELVFNEKQIISHFLRCILTQNVRMFPHRRKIRVNRSTRILVYPNGNEEDEILSPFKLALAFLTLIVLLLFVNFIC